jgi:hypothetical protein
MQMTAAFWIKTVKHTIVIPAHATGQPLHIEAPVLSTGALAHPVAKFTVTAQHGVTPGHTLKLRSTQIQYMQTVFLDFTACAGRVSRSPRWCRSGRSSRRVCDRPDHKSGCPMTS